MAKTIHFVKPKKVDEREYRYDLGCLDWVAEQLGEERYYQDAQDHPFYMAGMKNSEKFHGLAVKEMPEARRRQYLEKVRNKVAERLKDE